METLKKNKRIIYLITLFVFALLLSSCGNNSNSNKKHSNEQGPIIEDVYSAIENGYIKWGMTYEEVAKILGPGYYNPDFDEIDGIVTYAAYDKYEFLFNQEGGKLTAITWYGQAWRNTHHPGEIGFK